MDVEMSAQALREQATRGLDLFAQLVSKMPVAKARHLIWKGLLTWPQPVSTMLLTQSLESATRLGLKYEEALSRYWLTQFEAPENRNWLSRVFGCLSRSAGDAEAQKTRVLHMQLATRIFM